MRIRLPRRKILRAPIYLFCLLLVFIAVDMVWVQIRRSFQPGFDTTRIVGPLLGNGSIDYLTAIEKYYEDGVTPQNNSAVLILQALGRKALPPSQPTDGITERMGMPHLPEQGDYYVTYEDFCKQHGAPIEADPTDPQIQIVFSPTVGVQTKQWIEANTKSLSLMAEASKRSRYFIPFNGGYHYELAVSVPLPFLGFLREMHRAFLTRAMVRIGQGDFDGFQEDVMTVHRLARLLAQAPTLVERLSGGALALEISACKVERAVAASGRLSSAQTRKMASELAAMGDLHSIDDAVNITERYISLDLLQWLAKSSPTRSGELINSIGSHPFINPPQAFWLIPVPYEDSMRATNHYNDGIVAVLRLPTYPQRIGQLRLWEQQIVDADRHPLGKFITANWMAPELMPSLVRADERFEISRMERRLSQIALGLAAYKAEHGEYPASLDALVPSCFAAVPNDVFSEKPVIYAPTEKGYVLYSVGPNMTDDGGKSQKSADDIVASNP
jgi:hypothetical protein